MAEVDEVLSSTKDFVLGGSFKIQVQHTHIPVES